MSIETYIPGRYLARSPIADKEYELYERQRFGPDVEYEVLDTGERTRPVIRFHTFGIATHLPTGLSLPVITRGATGLVLHPVDLEPDIYPDKEWNLRGQDIPKELQARGVPPQTLEIDRLCRLMMIEPKLPYEQRSYEIASVLGGLSNIWNSINQNVAKYKYDNADGQYLFSELEGLVGRKLSNRRAISRHGEARLPILPVEGGSQQKQLVVSDMPNSTQYVLTTADAEKKDLLKSIYLIKDKKSGNILHFVHDLGAMQTIEEALETVVINPNHGQLGARLKDFRSYLDGVKLRPPTTAMPLEQLFGQQLDR